MNTLTFLDRISKVSLYLLVFLFPLWFLPFTQNILEYPKQLLLLALVLVGIILWLAKMQKTKALVFRESILHIPVVLFLAAAGISTLFSLWQYGSFWGWPLDVGDSFLTIAAFVLLYFLISQSVESPKQLFYLLSLFVASAALGSIFAILQLKGIFVLPFDALRVASFNTIGNANSIALFAAILLPLTLALASASRLYMRGVLLAITLVLFTVAALIDFAGAWIALIVGLFSLLVLDVWTQRGKAKFGVFSFPTLFIILALPFLFIGSFSAYGAPSRVPEVSPSYSGEVDVLKGVFREDPLRVAFGTGPGTFVYDYAKFHGTAVNQTIFWGTRFSQGVAEIPDWLVTKGVVGLASFALLIGAALWLGIRTLRRTEEKGAAETSSLSGMLLVGLGSSLLAAVAGQLLYPANLVLWFVFWVLLGSLAFVAQSKVRTIALSSAWGLSLGFSLILLLGMALGLGVLFMGSKNYMAEVTYLQGVRASREGNVDEALLKIAKAADLNSSVDFYLRDIAQLSLVKANQTFQDASLSSVERNERAQRALQNAIIASRRATDIAPTNVANWNVRGFIGRNLMGIRGIRDADTFAQEGYRKAAELEPASPYAWTELGRVYILQAEREAEQEGLQGEQEQNLMNAIQVLEQAIELKSDYAPAHYLIAVAYDQQGKGKEAIAKLEETKLQVPEDIGLAFQLGVMYYQRDNLEGALAEFERAKSLNSRYSNARYMLGLVYDKQGKQEDARVEFEAVAALNPDNVGVREILENLKAGRPALQGVSPDQPPIEDSPSEISDIGEEGTLESREKESGGAGESE